MIRAVFKNGMIFPLDPIPMEWSAGRPLRVEADDLTEATPEEIDNWGKELDLLAAEVDPADLDRLNVALLEADVLAKDAVRREMGLS